jgi:hypothetical protein
VLVVGKRFYVDRGNVGREAGEALRIAQDIEDLIDEVQKRNN